MVRDVFEWNVRANGNSLDKGWWNFCPHVL